MLFSYRQKLILLVILISNSKCLEKWSKKRLYSKDFLMKKMFQKRSSFNNNLIGNFQTMYSVIPVFSNIRIKNRNID